MSHRKASTTTGAHGTRRRILLAAARVLAARQAASMADIAAAAEITRGTLYRHFPARESLIKALEAAANEEAGRRLADANLDQVPVEEGLARATRALVTVGEDFIVLLRERRPPEPRFTAPLESLLVLVGACARTGKTAGMGVEDMSSAALRLFLTGARPAAD